MTDSVDIQLPSAAWLAKLTPSMDPHALLSRNNGFTPAQWRDTPLSTGVGFGGMLSLADVGHRVEPNLSPSHSLPLPGDRIILARTGRRVQVFGVLEVTGLLMLPDGGVRIGHRPVFRLSEPADLRAARSSNRLLDILWCWLFGHIGRDRRLLPLTDARMALCFTAMGISLEALFGPVATLDQDVPSIDAIPPWDIDFDASAFYIKSDLSWGRVADGVAVYHGAWDQFDKQPDLVSIEVSSKVPGSDLLMSMQGPDFTHFMIPHAVEWNETFRIDPSYEDLITQEAANTLITLESQDEWTLLDLTPSESMILDGLVPDQSGDLLRELGFLD